MNLIKKRKNKQKDYWNSRADATFFSGSNDKFLDSYETNFLIKFIKKKDKYILDIGCGNGLFLKNISKNKNYKKLVGIDYASKMIENARKFRIKNSEFYVLDINKCLDLLKFVDVKFDLIYTKRALINLDSNSQQIKAIQNISSLLKKGGRLICCESSQTSLDNINFFRKKFHLKKIIKPWHNVYFKDSLIINMNFKKLKLKSIYPFLSTWYFVSRVINAALAKKLKKNPDNNDFLSKISYQLPQDITPDFSQTKVFEFTKI